MLYRLDPVARRVGERLTEAEIALARERLGAVVPMAVAQLDRLFQMVSALGACIVLADAEGVVIERRGNPADDADYQAAGLWTGTAWSEAQAGTNAIGTCLAEGRAVTIHRDQHFMARNTELSCSSAPLHGPEGEVLAVIDVSTARADVPEAVAGLIAASVADAVRRLEGDLFSHRYAGARLVLIPGLDRGVGALLAVDGDDLVIGATRAARAHLNLTGDLEAAPRPVADVLGTGDGDSLEEAERRVLVRALARTGGNVSAAARALGLSRATLHRKLERH